MRKCKRIICMLLTVSMLLALCCVSSAETEVDALESARREKYDTLMALGVIADIHDMKYFDEPVTREVYASVLSGFYGVTPEESQKAGDKVSESSYSDVTIDRWSAGSIFYLTKTGIMSGYTDGKFRPTHTITVEQAVKGLVLLLGYEVQANYLGGYPTGYTNVALQLKMLEPAATYSGDLLAGEFVDILYNMVHTKILDQTAYGSEIFSYEVSGTDTPLVRYFDIYTKEGVLKASGSTALDGVTAQVKGYVQIGDDVYKCEPNYIDLIGQRVLAYYKKTESMNTGEVLYMGADEYENEIITVSSENISDSTTTSTFSYFDERDKARSINLPSDVDVIYNGKLKRLYTKADLMPAAGQVKLIDANGDGKYETVVVESYISYWVSARGNSNGQFVIYDKLGKNMIEVDLTQDEFLVLQDGAEVDLATVLKEAVISVAADSADETGVLADASIFKIYISDETVTGTVSMISDNEITIDGATYQLSPNYDSKQYPVKVGDSSVFYLDAYGNILAANTETVDRYAFLVAAKTGVGLDTGLQVKIYTDKGQHVVYECSDGLAIDGTSYRGNGTGALAMLRLASDEYGAKAFTPSESTGYEQLVKYRLNSAGQVSSIDTVLPNKGYTTAEEAGLAFGVKIEPNTYMSMRIYTDHILEGKVRCTENTLIFNIPDNLGEEKLYSVSDIGSLMAQNNKIVEFRKTMVAFDMGEYLDASVVISSSTGEAEIYAKELNNMMLVEKLITTMNNVGNIVTGIEGYSIKTGAKMTVTPADEAVFLAANIEVGDVMRWNTNTYGDAFIYEKTASPLGEDDGTFLGASASWKHDYTYNADFRISLGRAVAIDGTAIRIHYAASTLFPPSSDEVNGLGLLARVLIYDSATGKVTKGTIMDVQTDKDFGAGRGDTIFTYQSYNYLTTIVAYK